MIRDFRHRPVYHFIHAGSPSFTVAKGTGRGKGGQGTESCPQSPGLWEDGRTRQGLLCLGQNPVTYSPFLSKSGETRPNWIKDLEKKPLEVPRALQTQQNKVKTQNFYGSDLRRERRHIPLSSIHVPTTAPSRQTGKLLSWVPHKMADGFLIKRKRIASPQSFLNPD